jgi:hypothetical protein
MHFLHNLSHPYVLPLVECTVIGLTQSFSTLLQGEFNFLQAVWGFPFFTIHVQSVIPLFKYIIVVVRNLSQLEQDYNLSFTNFPPVPLAAVVY